MDIRIVVTAVMRRAMLFRTLEVRTANRKPRSDVNYADAALSYASPCCLLLELLATIAGSSVAPAPSPSALCSACFTNAPHRQVRGGQPCTMFPPAAFPCLGISGMITPDSPPGCRNNSTGSWHPNGRSGRGLLPLERAPQSSPPPAPPKVQGGLHA